MAESSNSKIDPKLDIAMSLGEEEKTQNQNLMIGYNENTKTWRLIIKYNGNIVSVCEKYNAGVTILSETYAIVDILELFIISFSNEKEVDYIEKPKKFELALDKSKREACITQVQQYPQYNLHGEGVIVGIVDSGIDYTHKDFIDENGNSRILFIWDQSIEGNPPQGFKMGTEYNNEQINEAIKATSIEQRNAIVPHCDFLGHGTHVAGIAAGNGAESRGLYKGVADKAKLIIVKLGVSDLEGYPINTINIMLAIKYLIQKAELLNMPIAINISYGSNFGAHDGKSIFETYVDDMAIQWKNSIVVSSGNEANKGFHTSGNVNQKKSIEFAVYDKALTISIDIWKSNTDLMNIEIVNSSGHSTGIIPYQSTKLRYSMGDSTIYIIFNKLTPFSNFENFSIEITIDDYANEEGIWTINFHPSRVLQGNYEIWLNPMPQDKCRFVSPVLNNTITLPATTENVISVGGYDYITGKISTFSGRGSLVGNNMYKPNIAAPCENITSTAPNGGYDTMSGTSMAAPFVTGSAALLMEWGIVDGNDPYLYGQKLKGYLFSGAKRDQDVNYPNNIWGYGKLCLVESLEIIKSTNYIKTQQTTSDDTMTEEERVMSEDFIDFIVELNSDLLSLAKDNPDIIIGKNFQYNLVVVYVKRAIVENFLNRLKVMTSLSYPLLFSPLDVEANTDANISPVVNNPNLGLTGKGTLIGILDGGIDYTHSAFRYEDGTTKIKAIWDQTVRINTPLEGYKYGTEYTEDTINQALESDNPHDIVPMTDDTGHGTFLAGVACGRSHDNNIGVAPDAEIVCVKLAPAKKYAKENNMIFDDEVVVYQDTDLILGMFYLIEKAQALRMPISIVLGLGTNQGGHDGMTYFPITGMTRNVVMTSACGNEGNSRKHIRKVLDGDTGVIELNVDENEQGLDVYIWGYAPDKFSISLISPSGEIIEKLPIKNKNQDKFMLIFYPTTLWITYFIAVDRNGDELATIRFKNPEPGMWNIILHSEIMIHGVYHAWLSSSAWSKPNTFFIDSNPECTITEIANSMAVISVGAYNHKNQNLYINSSRGPSRSGVVRPDIVAPGVNILGPYPNDAYGVRSGTSAACAMVAGTAALILQWGSVNGNYPNMSTQIVKSLLIGGARRSKEVIYPNNSYGYGILDLLSTFKELSTISFEDDQSLFIDKYKMMGNEKFFNFYFL